jgi:hypothetical protein
MITIEENDDRFYIKESTMKLAGKGLFAKRKIKKDEFLPITGVMVKRGSVADQCTYFFNSYKFAANIKVKNDLVNIGDYLILPLGYAGIVNHTDNIAIQSVEIRYVGDQYPQTSQHHGKAFYWFLRDVEQDEEIFGNYGHKWNDVLDWVNEQHSNTKCEKKDWQQFLDFDLYGLKKLLPR